MIYTELTFRAMNIAYEAHHGQKDKNGAPYIFHPIHLAEQMPDEVSCCVALLHDVAEDTDWTLAELAKHFPNEVIEPLRLLTHENGVPYMEYVRAIKRNPIAKKVKLADLMHNSDPSRANPAHPIPDDVRRRLDQRYREAMEYLLSDEE